MASSPSSHFNSFPILITILVALLNSTSQVLGCYTSIFSFGDSLTDSGNAIYDHIPGTTGVVKPPYGMTYFHHPAGRFSNGRLMVDFIAEKVGLPFPPPYLVPGKNFSQGANFAVAGATALDISFFEERGISITLTNNSLGIQLEWFKQLLPSLCSSPSVDCKDFLGSSLILLGEIGGNDLSFPLLQNRSLEEIQTFMPVIVNTLASAINTVIEYGARTILVPGNLPVGCFPAFLNKLKSDSAEDYDPQTGCLRHLNEFMDKYNRLLKRKLDGLRALHPDTAILYADYYNAVMPMYISPSKYGFSNGTLKACCGTGGPYHSNISAPCTSGLEPVCNDPSRYICWDGIHTTEAANQFIANRVMEVSYFTNTSCLSSLQQDGSHELI